MVKNPIKFEKNNSRLDKAPAFVFEFLLNAVVGGVTAPRGFSEKAMRVETNKDMILIYSNEGWVNDVVSFAKED